MVRAHQTCLPRTVLRIDRNECEQGKRFLNIKENVTMKKLILVAAVLALGFALTSIAQPGTCGNSCRHDGPGMGAGCCGQDGPGMGPGMGKMRDHGMRGGRMGMGDGPGFQRILEMADKLELTDAQREKMKQMQETFQLERIDRRASLEKAEVKLQGLMRDDKTPTTDINRAIDQVSTMKADIEKMQFRHRSEMRSVLTEKQQQMLKELRMERRKEVRVRVFDGEDDEAEGGQIIEKEIIHNPGGGK